MRRIPLVLSLLALSGTAFLFHGGLYEAFSLPKRAFLLGLGVVLLPAVGIGAPTAPPHPLRRALAAILLAGLLSLVNAASRVVALESLLYAAVVLALVLAAHEASASGGLRILARAVALVAGVVALLGVLQAVGVDPLFGGRPGPWAGSLVRRTTFSTLGSPTMLAEYLAVALPVPVSLALSARRAWERWASAAVIALAAAAILATAARGPLLALVVAPAVLAALLGRDALRVLRACLEPRRRRGLLLVAIALVASAGFWESLSRRGADPLGRFAEISDPGGSARGRLEIWRATLDVARSSLPFGAGIGCFDLRYLDARGRLSPPDPEPGPRERIVTVHAAHADPLQVLAEMGVAGLAVLLVVAFSFRSLARRAVSDSPDRAVAVGFAASLAVFSVASLVGFPLHVPATAALAAISLGGIAAHHDAPHWRPARVARLAAMVAGAVALALAVREGAAAHLASEGARLLPRDPDGAAEAFETALEWRPEDGLAALGLGRARTAQRRFEEAEVAFRRARRTHDDELLPVHLGRVLLYLRRPADAERVLRAAVRRNPDRAIARTHLAEALLVLGEREAGVRQLRAALRLDPDEPIARHHLRAIEERRRAR